MCVIIYNCNIIKSNDSYDTQKSIYDNFVGLFPSDVKFENFAMVDDVLVNTTTIHASVPKRISVYQLDFFKKTVVSEEFPKNVRTMSFRTVSVSPVGVGTKRHFEVEEEQQQYVPIKKKKTTTYNKTSKLCNHPGCTVVAWFGPPGQKKIHCSEHRIKGDTSYNPKRRCNNCDESFSYQKWYLHSKVCGLTDTTCNDCGGSFVNLFKHKYTCKNRVL